MTLACLLASVLSAAPARAATTINPGEFAEATPDALKDINVTEHLNAQLPLDLAFRDEAGNDVELRQYFSGKKPVILQLGYYGCPMLCGLITEGMINAVRDMNLTAKDDFEVVFVSIDPNEHPSLAQLKKQAYVAKYNHPGTEAGWHFLTGKQFSITELTKAVGYNYKWVASAQQFSHPATLIVLMPDGRVSRYLYGVRYDPATVRMSLVEASNGKIGTSMDQLFLTCFQYDGRQGKYALAAMGLMRLGGVLTVVIVTLVLIWLFRRDRKRARASGGFNVVMNHPSSV